MKLTAPRNSTVYHLDADTFRARSKAAFGGWPSEFGTNLQNVEKDNRIFYQADPGKKFAQVDQSGAEALIVAYLCENGKFRSLFLNKVKPHVFVALHNFLDIWKVKMKGIDVEIFASSSIESLKKLSGWSDLDKMIKSSDNWSPQERYYYIAKQMCHSGNYDIKAATFALNTLEKSKGTIVLSRNQAETYLGNYHSLFPEIRAWHRSVQMQVKKTGYLYNLQGHPFTVTCDIDSINDHEWKAFYARVPQSTVGVITHTAVINLQSYIENNKLPWDILANTHDSYLVQFPDTSEHEEHSCLKMQEFMNQRLTSFRGEEFQMQSEVAVGYNWAPTKKKGDKIINPEGLKER